ncbi:hypothetical protein [Rhodococcus pyridinivorans]|uniref:hypothetical protein n=1 Tax=Rhodococcus pyridinivorans TaxID=103816 RepID=UPI0026599377|nr:hypothetical protein [Rhodococcus pyridinivorans]
MGTAGGSLVIVATSDDAQRRAEQLIAALTPQQQQAVVDAIRARNSQILWILPVACRLTLSWATSPLYQ